MTATNRKPSKTPLLAAPQEGQCLDAVQLEALEREFRDWSEKAVRADIRVSRKRILLFFLLIRYTGAKLNEILSLDPFRDMDLKQGILTVHGRQGRTGSETREVPLPLLLAEEILALLNDDEFANALRERFGVDPAFVRRKFYERAAACGFHQKLGSPELIRRARAVELLQGNMPLPAVQNLLGHASTNQTESLVRFSRPEMDRLTRLFMEKEADRKTSARNSFYGKVTSVEGDSVLSVVTMSTLDGFTLRATITQSSAEQLGLTPERLVTAEVKTPTLLLEKMGNAKPQSSAENLFQGRITGLKQNEIVTECVVRISDMTELCAVITTESCRRLALAEGDQAWVMFNSFAPVLHADG